MKIIDKILFNTLYGILNILSKDNDYYDINF